jgi:acyl carrier protein
MDQLPLARRRVRELLDEIGAVGAEAVADEESLSEAGVLSSLLTLELLLALEQRFGIRIDDREVTLGNFDSVAGIASFLGAKLAAPA